MWKDINLSNSQDKIDFSQINSFDKKDVMRVIRIILSMWDLGNGRNEMRTGLA